MVDFNKMLLAEREKRKNMAKAKKGGTLITKEQVDYEAELAAMSKEAAESEPLPAGSFASLKGGLYIGGNRMKDDKADVVVLDHILENTLYVGAYDSEDKNPPTCYAYGRKEEEMRPAENAIGYWDADEKKFIKPDSCVGCPQNEWGSAKTGTGKACQNRRRLAFISANGIEEEDYIEAAEIVQLKLPVTSVKPWKGYVHSVAQSGSAPAMVVTTIERVEDDESMFKVNFQQGASLEPMLITGIKVRRAEAAKLLTAPYPDANEEEATERASGPKKKAGKTAANKKKFS